jgi:dTDP-4-amino-4,6-dideoxygalactose transaminase
MIKLFKPTLNQEAINEELPKVFSSGMIGSGPKVEEFTKALSKRFNREEVVATNSCTSSINLVLKALDIKERMFSKSPRILTTSLTCFASTSVILQNWFTPQWVDIDKNTMCMNLDELENHLDYDTRIILWTSWGGVAPDINRMQQISDNYNKKYGYGCRLYWILDLAHAFGTLYNGFEIPAIAKDNFFHCYSFGAIKTLTCGDGGAVVCPPDYYELVEKLNWYGISRKNNCSFRAFSDITDVGSKWNMNDINATIGLCNLRTVGYAIHNARENISYYLKHIKNDDVALLPAKTFEGTSGWLFTILVKDRDHFVRYMEDKGIEVNGVHRPNHTLDCVKNYYRILPQLSFYANNYVCIPCGPWLKQSDVEYITEKINAYKKD